MPPKRGNKRMTGGRSPFITGTKFYSPGSIIRPVMLGGAKKKYIHHPQLGYGFFDSVGNFFKKTLPAAARAAGKYIKDKKLLSTITGLIPHPAAAVANGVFKQVGLGRRRNVLSF